ncbi:MAG TPA: T9SS type A sorting domain-containing protein [Candidatus Cloacimonetes bacterium]|nr:T9SS type A sorting domain-containing protein [Candidatus Cloacimonadota bacterium]
MMKKVVIFLLTIILMNCLIAELMQSTFDKKAMTEQKGRPISRSRDVPTYEFFTDPTALTPSYFDYMPGSYNSIPVRIQPEISQPFGYTAGGVYMIYHIKETSAAQRREYYSYITNEGDVSTTAPIGNTNIWEGYGGIALDPVTADPFASWHQQAGETYNDLFTYDLYHMLGAPGLWREAFTLVDNTILEGGFIWPYVEVGPSPLGGDYRRVYVTANNAAQDTPSGNPSENIYLGYADYTTADLDAQSELDWTFQTDPLMDQWHNEEPWIRPFNSFIVSDDGKAVYIGYNTEDEIYVFYSDNYSEDGFEYVSTPFKFYVDNPQNQDGRYAFENDNGNPYDLYFSFIHSHHFNAVFTDNNTKIRFIAAFGLQGDDPDGGDGVYWPYAIYPKEFVYDINEQAFTFYDLYPTGANPSNMIPMLPWDLDENGDVDEYDEDGNVLWVSGWPIYFYDNDQAFHDNNFRIVQNEENGWLVTLWQDGLYAKYANAGVEGYEDWQTVPEIAVCISRDNGANWSEPFFMNSLDTPELADMIPCYVYPGDIIEDLGDGHGKLHLMFLDDNDFGSNVYSFGLANGGTMTYASLDIDFNWTSVSEPEIVFEELNRIQNFPNPFNSSTTISFFCNRDTENTEINIYNMKGQKVKTFSNLQINKFPNQQIVWDGTDEHNNKVSSGIYLYKFKIDDKTMAMNKCLLLR